MARELHIRQLSGADQNRELTIREFPLLIGRSDECTLRFDPEADSKVSALHAEIRLESNGTFHLADLDSLNGSFLNGDKVEGVVLLPERSILQVGHEGPKVDLIVREGGSGVSFKDIRRNADGFGAGSLPDADGRPLVETEESMQAYRPAEAPGQAISARIKPKGNLAMIAVIVAVGIALLGAILAFS